MTDPPTESESLGGPVPAGELGTMLTEACLELGHLHVALSSERQLGAAGGTITAIKNLTCDDAFIVPDRVSRVDCVRIRRLAEEGRTLARSDQVSATESRWPWTVSPA